MKFVRYNEGTTGLLVGDNIVDIGAARASLGSSGADTIARLLPGDGSGSWNDMIAHWDEAREPLGNLAAQAASGEVDGTVPLTSVNLVAPLPDRRNRIIALGANVAAHAVNAFKAITGQDFTEDHFLKEQRDGLPPWGFLIMPETVVGPEAEVKPEAGVQKFDYEVEVGVILASGGRRISADDFNVWGFTVWNDLSIRDPRLGIGPPIHRGAFNWALEKNFDTGNSCGPCVVVDEGYDVNKLRCVMRVNGEVRQDWSTADMIFGFAESVAYLSRYIELAPGDILCSGTGAGTAVEGGVDGDRWLQPGDRMEAEVEGVGILVNTVGEWRD
ncbi:MAG: 2-keto-4-pentenoate hydratase/2-oxohepta-3-ene-1,7-dioic acid hydratase in catechol pathway [Alphaproteobacteria bacterium]|jgi:2-keto-4-pentenoate hydratase/2-oxohepta-3-ene-1,7-dioic acid hydratase in catechol pathway